MASLPKTKSPTVADKPYVAGDLHEEVIKLNISMLKLLTVLEQHSYDTEINLDSIDQGINSIYHHLAGR